MKFILLSMTWLIVPMVGLSQNVLYRHANPDYTIQYFRDWLIVEKGEDLSIYAPQEGQLDLDGENLGISGTSANGKNVDELYTLYTKDFPKAFEDYHKIGEGDWKIDGVKSKWIECSNKKGNRVMTTYLCLIVKGERLFVFIGTSSKEKIDSYRDKFKAMMLTFKTL